MEQKEMLYEGKAKQVYATDNDDLVIIHYKDDATAFNNLKHDIVRSKGVYNNEITTIIFNKLKEAGIPTHYVETLNDRDQVCRKVKICYKDDALGDPLINDHHAVAVGAATYDELNTIYDLTGRINELLKDLFDKINVKLVDFKIEFGKTSDGQIVLADEISPDTCRLWDKDTNKKLDKDRFRRDLGDVIGAYKEIESRLQTLK